MGVETTVGLTLTNTAVRQISSNASGPLSSQDSILGGILVGSSSAGIKRLIVIPGVIDCDFEGWIHIMACSTLNPPMFVPKGNKIAQIVAIFNNQPHFAFQEDMRK